MLRYRFTRTSYRATYEKFTSEGSGFFAGADTQVARFGITRPLARTWEAYLDFGYSHNTRLQSPTATQDARKHLQPRICPGFAAQASGPGIFGIRRISLQRS